MNIALRTFKHLLPRARAWSITIDKQLRQFFDGLGEGVYTDAVAYFDDIYDDIFPQTTRQLDEWEEQFALIGTLPTEQERRDRIDAAWKETGGQSPRYLQDRVQEAGFDFFIHEWWELPISGAAVARDPGPLFAKTFLYLTGETAVQMGEGQLFGDSSNAATLLVNLELGPYTVPTDSEFFPFILYWSGATLGDFVQVPLARKAELETLLLKLCPAQQWIGLFVEYV